MWRLVAGVSVSALMGCVDAGPDAGGSGGPDLPRARGVFVDSLVEGIEYESGSLRGRTGPDGGFDYEIGELVTFRVGDILLGRAPGTPVVTPVELVRGAEDEMHPQVTNIARFLLTIDENGDPTDGIQISPSTQLAASGESVDFAVESSVRAAAAAVSGRVLVDEATAQSHVAQSLLALMAGCYDGIFDGGAVGRYSITISETGDTVGQAFIDATGDVYEVTGQNSSSGTFVASIAGEALTFSGTVERMDGSMSGGWAVDQLPYSGTFAGQRVSCD